MRIEHVRQQHLVQHVRVVRGLREALRRGVAATQSIRNAQPRGSHANAHTGMHIDMRARGVFGYAYVVWDANTRMHIDMRAARRIRIYI